MIGAGWVTQFHLPAWQKLAGRAEVVAIADPSKAACDTRQAAFGIAAGYASAEAMIEAETLDIVDICTPREWHEPMVRLAAARGHAIMCQKPLAPTLAEAEALLAALPRGARLMVHDNWRFRPVYRRMKSWLGAGIAGRVRAARLEFVSSGMIARTDGQRPALVRQPFLRGLRRLLVSEILIHHLDALRYLMGEFEIESARLERSNDDIIGEDVATIALRSVADGSPLHVIGNLAVHGEAPLPSDRLVLYGTEATIRLDGSRLTVLGPDLRDESFGDEANYQGGYDGAIEHFVECLGAGLPFETQPEDNLRTLALVEAVYERAGSLR